jgi:hypothetical protein
VVFNVYTNATFKFNMLFSKTCIQSIESVSQLLTIINCLGVFYYLPDGSHVIFLSVIVT